MDDAGCGRWGGSGVHHKWSLDVGIYYYFHAQSFSLLSNVDHRGLIGFSNCFVYHLPFVLPSGVFLFLGTRLMSLMDIPLRSESSV